MNDFTKEELDSLAYGLECRGIPNSDLRYKVLSMIDNYDKHNSKWIAKAHLTEAENLIHHAKCLLGMGDD